MNNIQQMILQLDRSVRDCESNIPVLLRHVDSDKQAGAATHV